MSKEHSLVIVTQAAIHVLTYEDKLAAEMTFDEAIDGMREGHAFLFREERILIAADGLLSMHICEGFNPTPPRV